MKIRYYLFSLALVASVSMSAQTKKDKKAGATQEESRTENLVQNPGFEVGDRGIKSLKSFGTLNEFCPEWISPNKTNADLFHIGSKSSKASAPANDYGNQMPYDGDSYVGIRAYTKDPKKSRTYIQSKLSKKLEKDKLYCFKFNVSLADNSKFAVNNFGIFLSDRKVSNSNDYALTYQPQILESSNKVLSTTDTWEPICGTYIATGKEEYIIIGAFGMDSNLKVDKMKKAPGATGVPLNDAYYFVDGLEIHEVEANSQCICGQAQANEPDLIYSRSEAIDVDAKPAQVIESTSVWFAFLSADVPSMFEDELAAISKLMKENTAIKIELTGHSETDEINEAKINRQYQDIAAKRAQAVKDILVKGGVNESRIAIESKDNTTPATDRTTKMAKAQNRRVEFRILK